MEPEVKGKPLWKGQQTRTNPEMYLETVFLLCYVQIIYLLQKQSTVGTRQFFMKIAQKFFIEMAD